MASLAPKLPAEIIHLIVDFLIEQSSGSLYAYERMDVLRTCSRVSWSFHLHSQKHRFSHIYFKFDGKARKRAKRLLQVLVPPRNHYLHPFISSVTFLVHPSAAGAGLWSRNVEKITQKVKGAFHAVGKKIKRELDWVTCAMIFLSGLDSLEDMTLASSLSRRPINWQEATRSLPELSKVLWLAMHPGLRHLTFKNLLNLPVLYMLARSEPPPRLRKLTIDNTSFQSFSPEPYKDLPPSFSRMLQDRLATVEELNWVCWGTTQFGPWPNQLLSFTPTYSSLTAIVIHLSPANSETNQFLRLLQSASQTLESLELHNVYSFGPELDTLALDYLGHFTALRHVGYKAKSGNTAYLRSQLDLFSQVLMTARKPLPSLSSISIDILEFCTPDLMSDDFAALLFHDVSPSSFPANRQWSALDDALCNPNFVNLRSVCFNVKLFVQTKLFRYHAQEHHLRSFVPQVYARPLIDIDVTIERIGGDGAYVYWVYESDGNV